MKISNNKDIQKKATIHDVAKLAGVSAATVSYVINGKTNQRITEQTKKKVLQVANFLNYSPNPFAVGLNKETAKLIAIRSSITTPLFRELEILNFMRRFNILCTKENYLLNYSADKRNVKLTASACICFDMPVQEFHALCAENYIPIIAIDCLINDPIFYQITINYQKLKTAADSYFKDKYHYVAITPANEEIREEIISVFPNVVFVSSFKDIKTLSLKSNNILLSQPSLFEVFDSFCSTYTVYRHTEHLQQSDNTIMTCINNAINRISIPDKAHFIEA